MILGGIATPTFLDTTNWAEIANWCSHYNKYNKYPCSLLERYAISIYQIHQGMEWKDETNKYESFAAAFLHLSMVSELISILPPPYLSILEVQSNFPEWKNILYLVSKLQQQIFYKHKLGKSIRSSRFNVKLTSEIISSLQLQLLYLIPIEQRRDAIINASKIMTGKL